MRQLWMDWQAFAEEAGQETGGEAGGQAAPDAGEQDDFAELIRGRYKAQFDARVQKILDGRLRGLRQAPGCGRRRRRSGRHRPGRCCACRRRRDASGRCIRTSTGSGSWPRPGSGGW